MSSSEINLEVSAIRLHASGFRQRRALNWMVLGMTYSAMYMGRYNLSLANPILSQKYGWDKTQVGGIISPALLAYGVFAMVNGPLADRIGGRKAMLLGASGTVLFNLLFGLGAYLGFLGAGPYLLSYFAMIWMMNSYFQSFGAVSLVKVNSAWFDISERGIFSAIFGSMIQLGRTLVFMVGPLIALAFSWQWLFFIPALVVALMVSFTYWVVKDDPSDCGFMKEGVSGPSSSQNKPVSIRLIIKKIFTNPITLSIALAEFCTGFVRQGFEQWFPRYMIEVQKLPLDSVLFKRNALAIVAAGIGGAVVAGTLSDWVFKGRRTPVACLGYLIQIICLLIIWRAPSLNWILFAFVLNSCAISVVQSMLSGTASMDFGGKSASATAAGLFDGMQYIGGSFVGLGMGWVLDHLGWGSWGPSMIGFSMIGFIIMIILWNARPAEVPSES